MKYLILSLLVLIFFLFGVAYFYLGIEKWGMENQFIKSGELTSSALVIDNAAYTLNFDQHEAVLDLLSASRAVGKKEIAPLPGISIEYYDAKGKASLILRPLNQEFSLFSISSLKEKDLAIAHPKELKQILQMAQGMM